jgi:hypothetical protein
MDQHKDQRMISDILHEVKILHFKFAVDIQHVYKLLEQSTMAQLNTHMNMNGVNGNMSANEVIAIQNPNYNSARTRPQIFLVDGKQFGLAILQELKRIHPTVVVIIFVEKEERMTMDGIVKQFRSSNMTPGSANGSNSSHSSTEDRIHILTKPSNASILSDVLNRYLQ